jgi:hypothetical protein
MVVVGICAILAGFVLSCLAIVQIIKPRGWLWMSNRGIAAAGLWVGALLFALGFFPLLDNNDAPRRRVQARESSPLPSPPPPPASKESPASRSVPEPADPSVKMFEFVVQGGQRISAAAQADASADGTRAVVFSPFIEKTDGNLYLAALETLGNVYGKERGLFQLRDAEMREKASLGGNAICWQVSNPTADYCIFPTKDEETGRIGALTVWIE